MTTLRIKRLKTRFRLTPSQMEEKVRLNSLLLGKVIDMLPRLLEERGISPNNELCIKSLHVPVALRLSNPDQPVAQSWCRAMGEEIERRLETGGEDVLLYRSRNHALMECAEKTAEGDLGRAWAWRSLGIGDFRETMTAGEAMVCFMNSLAREGAGIIPVLLHAARGKALDSFLGTCGRRLWINLAGSALKSAGADRSPPEERAGAKIHDEVMALRIMKQSKIMQGFISSFPGFLLDDEMACSAAVLALLEVEPAFVRMTRRRMSSAIEVVAEAVRSTGGTGSRVSGKRAAGASGSNGQNRYGAGGQGESGGKGNGEYAVGEHSRGGEEGIGENGSVEQSGYGAGGNGGYGAGGHGGDGIDGHSVDDIDAQSGYDAAGSIEAGGVEQNGDEGEAHSRYLEKNVDEVMCKQRREVGEPANGYGPASGPLQGLEGVDRDASVERHQAVSGRSWITAGESVRTDDDSMKSLTESSPLQKGVEGAGAEPQDRPPVNRSPFYKIREGDHNPSESRRQERSFSCSPFDLPGKEVTTEWGGLLFLINAMSILCLPEEMTGGRLFESRGMRWIMCRLATSLVPARVDDPAVTAFSGLAPLGKPLVAGALPCFEDPVVDASASPVEDASEQITGWRNRILDYLRRALSRDHMPDDILIDGICRRKGRIIADPGWIELHMDLKEVSVDLRCAGLDLDPGYVPWLGVVIKFHYS